MRVTLTESGGRRGRRPAVTLLSGVVHVAGIALAVVGTGWSRVPAPVETKIEELVYVERKPPLERTPIQPSVSNPVPSTASSSSTAQAPAIDIPIDMPTELPPITLPGNTWDPSREFTRPAGPSGAPGTPSVVSGSSSAIYAANFVERHVVAMPGVSPRYPQMLQQAGIEGEVTMRFVVDTLGRVEPGSAELLTSTHALFERAVRDALPRMRFVAAEAGGRKVRQLVEQPFSFAISR